jgi:hypothetical protein
MTSSRSSSSSRRAAALALALAACAHRTHQAAQSPESTAPALAVFPVQNASGGNAPIHALSDALEEALANRGVRMVPHKDVDALLARNRFRFTGGVDRKMAEALREAGVEAVLVPTLEQYGDRVPPKVALALRIVGTGPVPEVDWADVVARSGDDSPGLLALGMVDTVSELQRQVLARAADSVARWAERRGRGEPCARDWRFKPRRWFRAPVLDDVGRRTIAVLPFRNETHRRGAEDVLANEVLAQLARTGSFEVLDPGVVREQLLENRIVFEGGVSIDRALTILDLVDADLVLSGIVHDYDAAAGLRTPPTVGFSAFVIDRATAEVVWSSTSTARGDDWVFLFGSGELTSPSALTCRMARGVVDGIVGERGLLGTRSTAEPPQRMRVRWGAAQFQRHGRDANSRDFEQNAVPGRARDVNQAPGANNQAPPPKEPQ